MKVILYSTHCPKCNVLEKKLNDKKIGYTVITDENVMIKKGFMTSPMLEVDEKVMGFSDAIKFINELE